jgi:phage protein D
MSVEDRLDRLEKIVIHLQYLTLLHADFFKGRDERRSVETLGQLVSEIAAEHGLDSAES